MSFQDLLTLDVVYVCGSLELMYMYPICIIDTNPSIHEEIFNDDVTSITVVGGGHTLVISVSQTESPERHLAALPTLFLSNFLYQINQQCTSN